MLRHGDRRIKVHKSELLKTLKENRAKHIAEYEVAIKAYKLEAEDQLKNLLLKAQSGKLGLNLDIVEPVNNSANYDKVISMFEWEVEEFVFLSQDEFKEYILDENHKTEVAKLSNAAYSAKWGF